MKQTLVSRGIGVRFGHKVVTFSIKSLTDMKQDKCATPCLLLSAAVNSSITFCNSPKKTSNAPDGLLLFKCLKLWLNLGPHLILPDELFHPPLGFGYQIHCQFRINFPNYMFENLNAVVTNLLNELTSHFSSMICNLRRQKAIAFVFAFDLVNSGGKFLTPMFFPYI